MTADRAALAARLTETAAALRLGYHGGLDVPNVLDCAAAALLAAPERTWENISNATVQHLPTFGKHEGVMGVSCSCGAWIPEDGWRDAQRRWWAHVTSAVLAAVIAWRREDISAGKLAEVLGLSPTTHEMRDLQFVYDAAPEREALARALLFVATGTEWEWGTVGSQTQVQFLRRADAVLARLAADAKEAPNG